MGGPLARPIRVVDYDAAWPAVFARLAGFVWPAVREVALRIDHVGSTSVPGLAAKPIIDLDVVVASAERIEAATERLSALGFTWVGNLDVIGREAFDPPPAPALPEHHLYLVVENNKAHLDHVLLRDLLREDGAARERYAALKRDNARRADGDLAVYTALKAQLVAELLTKARADRGLPPATYWIPTSDELHPR